MTGSETGGSGLWARIVRALQSVTAPQITVSTPPPEPVVDVPEVKGIYSPNLGRLLTPGMTYRSGEVEYLIRSHQVGDLVLPTGQIAACDPLVGFDVAPAFTVTVDPGTYPVVAWVTVLSEKEKYLTTRTAALQLVVRDAPVARWEMALIGRQSTQMLASGQFFGYPVDAGMGCLGDLTAVQGLGTWDEARMEKIFIPFDYLVDSVPSLVRTVVDEASGANIIAVASGWGDGTFPTFIGYTEDDQLACFVTDFRVVPNTTP